MSDLTFNKIAGAVLATGLAIFGLQQATEIMFEKAPPAKAGYAITVAADTSGGAEVADVPPDWGTALPKADIAAGEAISAKCQACHKLDASGANNIGPGLWGVVGRKPGTHPGFAYSQGMTDFGAKQPIWDYDHLYDFLKGPQNYINGTKMTFIGLKSPQDRINIIAYLHTLGSTLPVPPPKPAAATPAGPAKAAVAGTGTAPAAPPASSTESAGKKTATPAVEGSHPGGSIAG